MSSSPSTPTAVPSPASSVPIAVTPAQLEQYINRKGGIDRLSRAVLDHFTTTPESRTAAVLASTRHMLARAPPNADKPSLMAALSLILEPIESSVRRELSQIIPRSLSSAPDWLRHAFQDEYNNALSACRAEHARNHSLSAPPNGSSRTPIATPSTPGSTPVSPIQTAVSNHLKRRKVSTTNPQLRTPLNACPPKQSTKPPVKPSRGQNHGVPIDCKPTTPVLNEPNRRNTTQPSSSPPSALVPSAREAQAGAVERVGLQQLQKDITSRPPSHSPASQQQETPGSSIQVPGSVLTTTAPVSELNNKQPASIHSSLYQSSDQPLPSDHSLGLPPNTALQPPSSTSVHFKTLKSHQSLPEPSVSLGIRTDAPITERVDSTPPSSSLPCDLPRSAPLPPRQPNSGSCDTHVIRAPPLDLPPIRSPIIAKKSSRKTSPKKSLPPGLPPHETNIFTKHVLGTPCQTSADRFETGSENHTLTNSKVVSASATKEGQIVRPLPSGELPSSSLPSTQRVMVEKQSGSGSKNPSTMDSSSALCGQVENPRSTSGPPKACKVRRATRFSDLVCEPVADGRDHESTKRDADVKPSLASGKSTSSIQGGKESKESRSCVDTGPEETNRSNGADDKTQKCHTSTPQNCLEPKQSERQSELPIQNQQVDIAIHSGPPPTESTKVAVPDTSEQIGGLDVTEKILEEPSSHRNDPIRQVTVDGVAMRHNVIDGVGRQRSSPRVGTPVNVAAHSGTSGRNSTTAKEVMNTKHLSDRQEACAVQNLSATEPHTESKEGEMSCDREQKESTVIDALARSANVGSGIINFENSADASKSEQPEEAKRVVEGRAKVLPKVRLCRGAAKPNEPDKRSANTKVNDESTPMAGSGAQQITCAVPGASKGTRNAKHTESGNPPKTSPLKVHSAQSSTLKTPATSPLKSRSKKRRKANISKNPRNETSSSQRAEHKPGQGSPQKRRADLKHLETSESKKRKTGTESLEILSHAAAKFVEVAAKLGESQPCLASEGKGLAVESTVVQPDSVTKKTETRPEDFASQQKVLLALREVMKKSHAVPFLEPVDLEGDFGVRYCSIVKQPMDLGTIEKRLCNSSESQGFYRSVTQVLADLELVWENCRKFNGMYDDVTLAANKCADELGILIVRLGVEMPKRHVGRRRSASFRQTAVASPKQSPQPAVKLGSKAASRKRKFVGKDEDLQEIIAATTPCHGDNDGQLCDKEIAVFTALEGRVKAWYRVKVNAYDTQTKSYSLTWIGENMQTTGATFGINMQFPVYRA